MKSFPLITLLLAFSLFVSACANNAPATENPAPSPAKASPTEAPPATEAPAATNTPPNPTATSQPQPQPTATPEPAIKNTAKFETYTHPSGAFSIDVPSAWEINTESDDQVIIYDQATPSILMAFIFDVGVPLGGDELTEFSQNSVNTMMAGLTPNFKILQEGLVEGTNNQYSSFMDFASTNGGGQAQFIYTQDGNAIFLLAFISSDYFSSIDTWKTIRDSHQIDSSALKPTE